MQTQILYVISSFKVLTNSGSDKIGLTVNFLCSAEVVGGSQRGSLLLHQIYLFFMHFSELLARAPDPN